MRNVRGLAFDAYGTLVDVYSVTALCDHLITDLPALLGR